MYHHVYEHLTLTLTHITLYIYIGAGTLGCSVARTLLGWGITNITFVDNGRVSYSNPARQCLFDFEDAKENRYKALAAATQLIRVCPYVKARGIVMNIPMPGHHFNATLNESEINEYKDKFDSNWVYEDGAADKNPVAALDDLVRNHDCVFSLLDSREGRWLPTLLCSVHNTLMITAALGFDSYLVMRHGLDESDHPDNSSATYKLDTFTPEKLGCYFCSDVVSPCNSQKERSLDQQCTVTRAGMSPIAGALAVELMISSIQESLSTSGKTPTPHQLRGEVSSFSHRVHEVPAFNCCVGCSRAVVERYQKDGLHFVSEVCNDDASASFLEEASGITQLTAGE